MSVAPDRDINELVALFAEHSEADDVTRLVITALVQMVVDDRTQKHVNTLTDVVHQALHGIYDRIEALERAVADRDG